MNHFPEIRHTLAAVFAVDIGLSEVARRECLERLLQSAEWKRAFELELREAFAHTDTCWSKLLFNDRYEVVEADSETEARARAADMLWEPTFPGEPIPEQS